MRVLLGLHQILDPDSGAAGVTVALGAALQAFGCDVEYFDFNAAFGNARLPGGNWATVQYPWRVARFLRRRAGDFDVLDITTGNNWVWAALGRPGAKSPHALITRSHGLEHIANREIRAALAANGEKPGWKFPIYWAGYREWEVRQSLLRSDMNLLLNELDRDFACTHLGITPGKITVLPNGIAPAFEKTVEPTYSPAGPVKLAFVGSWIERKGISAVAESVRLLETRSVDCRLTIYGARAGTESVLNSFAASVRARVNVIPAFKHAELPALLTNEQVLLFPSRSEGFSVALIEAMACGLAPIATPVGAAPQLIKDGQNGMLIPVGDASALAVAVAKLSSDRAALLAMRRAARLTALEYGWDRIARKTLDVYEAVLRAGVRARQ